MRLFRHTAGTPEGLRGVALAIGNFDGVHRGHAAVMSAAMALAERNGVASGVLTFEPHPRSLFRPDTEPFRLASLRSKARRIESLDLDAMFVRHFDRDFASLTAEAFVTEILVHDLGVSHVVVGQDFVFGRGRKGSVDLLRALAPEGGFGVTAISQVRDDDGTIISSNTIRDLLRHGRPDRAATLLGRPWEVSGRIVHGDARGRELGFPTANLRLPDDLLRPAPGVYAVRAGIDEGPETRWFGGAANFGIRPHFDGEDARLEVHLFGFSGDLYGRNLRVAFIAYLRPEARFDSLDALLAQMNRDCAAARDILERDRFPTGALSQG